jgi:adenosylhomocysteine nucleosidase
LRTWLARAVGLVFWAALTTSPAAQERLDETPRIAVISAFAPELAALQSAATDIQVEVAGPTAFVTGRLEGRPVVMLLSGMSMVNAALRAQQVLDRFHVTAIVVSGIAGGVDPALSVGDVVAPERWAQPQESVMARETAPGVFTPPADEALAAAPFAAFGMWFPKTVEVSRMPGQVERRTWFPADPGLLAAARRAAPGTTLARCAGPELCLKSPPRIVVGGAGVSSQAFVDNAALRAWLSRAFEAQVLDMESAAIAQVAYLNATPFIAFRSLSDLTGGDPGANQWSVFVRLAAANSASVVRSFLRALPDPADAPAQPAAK